MSRRSDEDRVVVEIARTKKCHPRAPRVSECERVRRPLVSQRDRLLAVGRDVHGRERRRMRGLRGAPATPRLPREPRRRRALADAVPDLAEPRRRVRHRRLLRRGPAVRQRRRVRRLRARGGQPRYSRARRSRRQPHVRPPPVVRRRAPRSRLALHDWYVWADKRPPDWKSGMVFPGVQKETWSYAREVAAVLLPPLLRLPAGPEHGEPARPRGGAPHHRVLAAARRRRLPHGCGSFRDREADGRRRRRADHFEWLRSSGSSCSGARGDAVLLGEANVEPRDGRPTSRAATGST